jgi:hypothetical protein
MSPARNTPSPRSTLGRSGEDQERCRHGRIASSSSQRHRVETDTRSIRPVVSTSSRSSARLQRPSGTPLVAGSSQAIALTSMTTAEGKRRDRPGRLRSLNPRTALLAEPLAPLRHRVDRHPKPARDLDVLLCLGGEHDPGPEDVALLRGRPAQPAPQHPPLGGCQRDRERAGATHERLTPAAHPAWWPPRR